MEVHGSEGTLHSTGYIIHGFELVGAWFREYGTWFRELGYIVSRVQGTWFFTTACVSD